MLLYPTVSHPVDFAFETQGHIVRVVTLDLRVTWENIKASLLDLLRPWEQRVQYLSGIPASQPL
jgi:hypothetical protein